MSIFNADTKKFENHDIYIIPANYSGWYLSRDFDHEHEINYFTEDIGLNAYYFYLRKMNPIWLKSDEMEQKYRGEEYLYTHFQLLVRYLLERSSNNMGDIGDFDWHDNFYVGYYPTMTYHTGLPFPQRAYFSKFPYHKYKYIKVRQSVSTVPETFVFIISNVGEFDLDSSYILTNSRHSSVRTTRLDSYALQICRSVEKITVVFLRAFTGHARI